MKDFISWIDRGNHILFLTAEDVYHTKRGEQLQKYFKRYLVTTCDAIEFYYNIAPCPTSQKVRRFFKPQ